MSCIAEENEFHDKMSKSVRILMPMLSFRARFITEQIQRVHLCKKVEKFCKFAAVIFVSVSKGHGSLIFDAFLDVNSHSEKVLQIKCSVFHSVYRLIIISALNTIAMKMWCCGGASQKTTKIGLYWQQHYIRGVQCGRSHVKSD